ncbi:hypothetical protein HZA85_04330 [Candidatus Uhrbacteria bacterium]|nr:hypothetical protein [Candidatus Uhrbacteria bacterium]
MSNPIHEKILAALDTHGCAYETQHHEPTPTSQDAARVRGVELHAGAKALVVRGDKTKTYFLFVIPADLKLDGTAVRSLIGERVSFAQDPESVTGCVPGSVPPFGSILGLQTYVDSRLAENKIIHFNAGSLTDSVSMSYTAYLEIEKPHIATLAK